MKSLRTNAVDYGDAIAITSILDDIIRMKRQSQQKDIQTDVTSAERKAFLEDYKQFQELRNTLNGRVLLEYTQGPRTIVEEVLL